MSIREVGRSNSKYPRCPICGKPDWCADFEGDEGYNFIVCKRDTTQQNIQGIDGNFYMFVSLSKEGNSIYEDAHQRIVRTGNREDNPYSFKKFEEQTARKLVREEEVSPLPNSKLNLIYRELLSMLILEDRHKKYLKDEGWTDEMILKSGVKSFPVNDYVRWKEKVSTANPKRSELGKRLFEKFGDLTGVPGAYIQENEKGRYWTFAGADGIIFPIPDVYGYVYRLRIRLEKVVKSSGKYRNLSSYKEVQVDNALLNKYINGCRSGNAIGFYDHNCMVANDYYICYLTEGEKKAIVGNKFLNAPVISIPGVKSISGLIEQNENGERMIDVLKRKGVHILIIALDADKHKNNDVMQAESNIINLLRNEGFMLGIAEWNQALGKGLDDILVNGHRPLYYVAS